MRAIIIEDEILTAKRLAKLVEEHTDLEIIESLHSVKSAVKWLSQNPKPEIIFLDIQLGDGSGFDVLESIGDFPFVIFTTAFDQYAIDAFKYNSVDYLLKPVKVEELQRAVEKYKKIRTDQDLPEIIDQLKTQLIKKYKQKFLIKTGEKYHSIELDQIAYFYSVDGYSYLQTKEGKSHIVDLTLDELSNVLDPQLFFRINRHMIISATQMESIESFFNNRLMLKLKPTFNGDVIVSREKVKAFKQWLDE
jgi:two-component system, LytTR family, response regulator LytT